MIYEWVVPFEKVDANEAGKVCEELESSVGLTKETLLDASRAEDAPLHKAFEWDDSVAGEKYRLMQSGKIIRNLRIVSTSPKKATTEPVRAFVTTQKSNKELHKYESVMSVVRDDTKRDALLNIALKDLQNFKRKYSVLSELRGVMDAIDEVTDMYAIQPQDNQWQRVNA